MSTKTIQHSTDTTINDILAFGQTVARDNLQIVPDGNPGQLVAQGDINFTRLPSVPKNVKSYVTDSEKAGLDRQLAEGNSKGSRHIINNLQNCNVHVLSNPNAIQGRGYILEVTGETIVEHPEHGDLLFRDGVFLVTHQRAYAEDLRRAAD